MARYPSAFRGFPKFHSLKPAVMWSSLPQCPALLPSPSPTSPLPPLPSLPLEHKKSSSKRFTAGAIVAILVGVLALFFLIVITLLLCIFKREDRQSNEKTKRKVSGVGRGEKPQEEYSSGVQRGEQNKLFFFNSCSYNFDLEDLLRASAEVLGKGTYGTAYKAVLEDGTTVVVKRVKEVVAGKKEFEQQMELIGRVGYHPNLLRLIAYYYSKDEKLFGVRILIYWQLLCHFTWKQECRKISIRLERQIKDHAWNCEGCFPHARRAR
ncbi:hypothetical protein HPP92_001473 [Vanilla planifolia]|uniref:Protein kinase domain-containing protein n=1 Tax=Vanilla planifolia TaxID=51239 RepID=A0A835VLV6_VANPL|nr:hypothetical protein HPP92_001473 [Vanilla planifolia]